MVFFVNMFRNNSFSGMKNCKVFLKDSDFSDPSPAMLMVFADVREDSVDNGTFGVNMSGFAPNDPAQYAFWDLPGSYHARGASFSFADGRVEMKRWQHASTTPPLVKGGAPEVPVRSFSAM